MGFDDPAIRVLASHREDPAQYAPEVEAATRGTSTVWFVASHLAADVGDVEASLGRAGFTKVEERDREGALLSLWSRLAGARPAQYSGL